MRRVTINWPMLPPSILRGNGRGHWRVKARKIAEVRTSGGWSAVVALDGRKDLPLRFEAADVHYTFFTSRPDATDDTNFQIGMKPFLDGLRDAQVVVDDQNWRVTETTSFEKCKRGDEHTIITIKERRLSA